MIRRRTSPRRGPARDEAYKARVRKLRCACCGFVPSECNHSTVGRGLGQKASDYDTFPLCTRCHGEWTANSGRFWGWSKERRRLWQLDMVSAAQGLLKGETVSRCES